jgi:hypothetical protein
MIFSKENYDKNDDKKEKKEYSIFLQPRSLIIFTNDAYENYYHKINDNLTDKIDNNCININESKIKLNEEYKRNDRRVSLTIRRTIKVIDRNYSINEKEEIERRKKWWYYGINEEKRE